MYLDLLNYLESFTGNPWGMFWALALATYASEDLACISGGLLAAAGHMTFPMAAGACALGIWSGDLGVYLLGYLFSKGALKWKWLSGKLTDSRISRARRFFDNYGAGWIFLTRFLPGSRVVSYLAAGAIGWNFRKFSIVLAAAAIIWTPLLCGAAMLAGKTVIHQLADYGKYAWLLMIAAGVLVWLIFKLIIPLFTWRGRRQLYGKWLRLTHWEFWPMGIVYFPVGLYIVWLAIRYRSLTLFTASSPAIQYSGFAMDSKGDILDLFASDDPCLPAYLRIRQDKSLLEKWMQQQNISFPIVLKPDIGERGQGVAIICDAKQAERYLTHCKDDVIAQEFIPGLEYGVFYQRLPGSDDARIFSLSCKHPQSLTGDGKKTLEDLILTDPRAVAMAGYYFKKFESQLDDVLPMGEKFPLAEIGTHSRGAIFTDDRELITPELTREIDRLTRSAGKIYCGRYDLRVPSVEDLQAGKNLSILEFNGVTGEPAHIYQPGFPWWKGLRDLCRQWKFAFKAGNLNRKRGYSATGLRELLEVIRQHRSKEWFEADELG